ncbi:MAG TPA: TrkH family potassium uptake protein [Mesotoga sp.]|nr:TrkH family potassium uptake protein [Mesotoga sp.]
MKYVRLLKERYSLIMNYTGVMMIGCSVVLALPVLLLIFYPFEVEYAAAFLIPAAIAALSGFLLRRFFKGGEEAALSLHEGGIIIVLAWFASIVFSSLPFMIAGLLGFSEAFFESVSGWTTTGLSMMDVSSTPHLFLFWRSLMQFVGGAGIAVVMLSAIIGPLGPGLYNAEGRSDLLLPNVRRSTRLIVTIYFGYTALGTVLYAICGMGLFDSVNHAMSALSTGGFSTRVGSIGEYNSLPIEAVTIALMILGTVNFAASYLFLRGRFKQFFKISELRFGALLLLISIPLVSIFSLSQVYGSLPKAFRVGLFELTSALSTTGFSITSYASWGSLALFMLIIFMIVGGGTGSTAGGAKQYRIMLLAKSVLWNIRRYSKPGNYTSRYYVYRPDGKFYLTKNHFIETANYVSLYIMTFLIGVVIITASGYSLKDAMFEFASSLGTVGLSVGVTSPDAPLVVTWTQIVGMILGRLEFFVIFYSMARVIRDAKHILKN